MNTPQTALPSTQTSSLQTQRLKLLSDIETKRGSKCILFVTGDRKGMETQIAGDVVDYFVEHLDATWPTDRLSLVLHTTGGNTSAAWGIINLLRTFCNELEVIIPTKALSAGTLISLGANKIVMTKQATLGPIDPSLNGPLNPLVEGGAPHQRAPVSVEAVQGYLDVAQKDLGIKDSAALASVLKNLAEQVHPLVLGQIFRTRGQIRSLATRLLKHQDIDEDRLEGIVAFLCSESGSHDHTINRREARTLGLNIENPDDDLYDLIRDLHHNIRAELKLNEPFVPALELGTNSEVDYSAIRCLLESVSHGCHQFITAGKIRGLQLPGNSGTLQMTISEERSFEGWKKVS